MILRLVESDLHKLISSAVKKILRESANENAILSKIVERLTTVETDAVTSFVGENNIEIYLDDDNTVLAFIDYTIDDDRILVKGQPGNLYDRADDPDEEIGDFDVIVTAIEIDDDGNNISIKDNGMVAEALKSLVKPEIGESNQYDYDEYYGRRY